MRLEDGNHPTSFTDAFDEAVRRDGLTYHQGLLWIPAPWERTGQANNVGTTLTY